MYRMPSARRERKSKLSRLNLIPILDAIFIFIFFLLTSATFVQLFEVSSTKPIVSTTPPKKNPKTLALTLKIYNESIQVMTGIPSRQSYTIGKVDNENYDLEKLHEIALNLKKSNLNEDTVIIEPLIDLPYAEIIKVIDSVRLIKNTDEAFFKKNSEGIEEKVELLFDKVVFGNLLS